MAALFTFRADGKDKGCFTFLPKVFFAFLKLLHLIRKYPELTLDGLDTRPEYWMRYRLFLVPCCLPLLLILPCLLCLCKELFSLSLFRGYTPVYFGSAKVRV